jgi:hypothetical protein
MNELTEAMPIILVAVGSRVVALISARRTGAIRPIRTI